MVITQKLNHEIAIIIFENLYSNPKGLNKSIILTEVAKELQLPREDKEYQASASFTLTWLKKVGFAESPVRTMWVLTDEGRKRDKLNLDEFHDLINEYKRTKRKERFSHIPAPRVLPDWESEKRGMLSEILEQNKRILDYLGI